jgi:ribonuclease VapC
VTLRRPPPADVVLDTSAIVAILLDEPQGDQVSRLLADARGPIMSAANVVELLIVAEGRAGPPGAASARQVLDQADVVVIPVDDPIAAGAHAAWRRFGKGNHPAALNYGDCFAYALARHAELPLLCVGDDFSQTDLRLAIR